VKLGVVLPRYGVDVVGGTEHWLQILAEHLVEQPRSPGPTSCRPAPPTCTASPFTASDPCLAAIPSMDCWTP
jgi:hypothetical protein